MKIKYAITREDVIFCSRALLEFRPNLDPATFADQTMRMMKDGFQLIYIPNDVNTEATAVAGFRKFEMLRTGPHIYIDDLFTFAENRGKGYAGALLDFIHTVAKNQDMKTVQLDSGHMLHTAHRLYLNKGYFLGAHHFIKMID